MRKSWEEAYCFSGGGKNDCYVTFPTGEKIKVIKGNGLNSVIVYFCRRPNPLEPVCPRKEQESRWAVKFVEATRSINPILRFCIEVPNEDVTEPKLIQVESYVGNKDHPDLPYHRTEVEFSNLVIMMFGLGKRGKLRKLEPEELDTKLHNFCT